MGEDGMSAQAPPGCCPACHKPLHASVEVQACKFRYQLWCPHGECDSDACNQVAEGMSPNEAYLVMEERYDRELAKLERNGK